MHLAGDPDGIDPKTKLSKGVYNSDTCDIANGEPDTNENEIPDFCELLRGDLNLDGCVDGGDLGLLVSLWGFPNPPIGDLNQDGFIDGADLGLMLFYWAPCG